MIAIYLFWGVGGRGGSFLAWDVFGDAVLRKGMAADAACWSLEKSVCASVCAYGCAPVKVASDLTHDSMVYLALLLNSFLPASGHSCSPFVCYMN